jgi:hypothetical protein
MERVSVMPFSYTQLRIVEALPLALFHPEGGESLLQNMTGARIVRTGSVDDGGIEGGGLLID